MKEQEGPVDPALIAIFKHLGEILRESCKLVSEETGEVYGFGLLMFPMKAGGRTSYISNCNREDMIAGMKEFIARSEGTYGEFGFGLKPKP